MQFVKIERILQSKLENHLYHLNAFLLFWQIAMFVFILTKKKKDTFNNVSYFRVGYVEFYF
jgi:hypothetical protein